MMIILLFLFAGVLAGCITCATYRYINKRTVEYRPMIQRSMGLKYDIYLAGPMRGYGDKNRKQFQEYADALRAQGHRVFSPAEMNDDHLTYEECMYVDVNAVVNKCKWVVVLPSWRYSVGTNVEVFVANSCGVPVMEAHMDKDGNVLMAELDSQQFTLPYL